MRQSEYTNDFLDFWELFSVLLEVSFKLHSKTEDLGKILTEVTQFASTFALHWVIIRICLMPESNQ